VQLVKYPSTLDIGASLLIAFMLNLFLTGVFAFLGFVFPTNKILPQPYYKVERPKRLKYWYSMLGVKYFKVFLLVFFWGTKKNRTTYFGGSRKDFSNLIYQSKQSEFGHLGALVVIGLSTLILLFYGYTLLALFSTFINLIGNFYPIPLQRMHRMRIDRIQKIKS